MDFVIIVIIKNFTIAPIVSDNVVELFSISASNKKQLLQKHWEQLIRTFCCETCVNLISFSCHSLSQIQHNIVFVLKFFIITIFEPP